MSPSLPPIKSTAESLATQLLNEGLIDLTRAAACFADARGRKPHIATLRRWAKSGCKGHILETTFLGNRLMTSELAAIRFLAAINGQPIPTPIAATSAAEKAGRDLDELLQ